MRLENGVQYDNEKINEIANTLNIADYLNSIGECPEKQSSGNIYFACRNTGEDHASLCVNTKENYFHCFSCHTGGNLLSYLYMHEGLSFNNACRKILKIAGLSEDSVPTVEEPETFKYLRKLKREYQKSHPLINREYQDYSSYEKYPIAPAQEWLDEGIPADVQRLYNVRTDKSRNRILYPLYDATGTYICSKHRSTLPSDILDKIGESKYKSDGKPGTIDFFVGMKQAEEAIRETGEVILFEGIKSCMKAASYGFRNTVACETCAMNKAQIKLLIKMQVKTVTIAFDKDRTLQDIKSHLWLLPRFANVWAIEDTDNLLGQKDSPVDCGKRTWKKLYKERIRVN